MYPRSQPPSKGDSDSGGGGGGALTANSVTSSHIVDGAILAGDIASSAITNSHIAANAAINGSKIGTGIDAAKITDATLTHDKLATSFRLSNANIDDDTISGSKIAGIDASKITDATLTHDKLAASFRLSNANIDDDTISGGKIEQGTITNDTINTNAAIEGSKLLTQSVTGTQMQNNTITHTQIAPTTVRNDEIASDAAIVGSKLAANSIPEAKIQTDAAGSDGQYLKKNAAVTSGWEWASVYPTPANSNSEKVLKSDGAGVSWVYPSQITFPIQTTENGKFLMTNGYTVSWETAGASFPPQANENGKFLMTNGSTVSWETTSAVAHPATANLQLNDDKKVIFGTGSDAAIFHGTANKWAGKTVMDCNNANFAFAFGANNTLPPVELNLHPAQNTVNNVTDNTANHSGTNHSRVPGHGTSETHLNTSGNSIGPHAMFQDADGQPRLLLNGCHLCLSDSTGGEQYPAEILAKGSKNHTPRLLYRAYNYHQSGTLTTTEDRWWAYRSDGTGRALMGTFMGTNTPVSDDRLKFNEAAMAIDGIATVKALQPKRYHQKESLKDADDVATSREQIGFIAQDVEAIPGLACLVGEEQDCREPHTDMIKNLQYDGITVVNTKALQELIARVESIEARLG